MFQKEHRTLVMLINTRMMYFLIFGYFSGGNYNWSSVNISIDVYIPSINGTDGVFLAACVDKGGCDTDKAKGAFIWFYPGKMGCFFLFLYFFLGRGLFLGGTNSVFLAAWVDKGGCDMDNAKGAFIWFYPGKDGVFQGG